MSDDPRTDDNTLQDNSTRTWVAVIVLAMILIASAVAALLLSGSSEAETPHGHGDFGPVIGEATRHTGPQGQVGQFVAKCTYSHSAMDDPIVHFGDPGRSHRHDFYGARHANAFSTAEELHGDETTCDKPADSAAYWQPTLYDHDKIVVPVHIHAYYRAAPGVDPAAVQPFPFGMELIAGDQTISDAAHSTEAAGWVCGSSTQLNAAPPNCAETAPLHMLLTFPDCWDGEHIRAEDFRSHAAYSARGKCPSTHPVHIPQLTVSVKYPIYGTGHDLRLASGNVYSAHGDFLNGWDPAGIKREIDNCIHRDVVCDLASNREEDGPFLAN